jgi:hypothetical protein
MAKKCEYKGDMGGGGRMGQHFSEPNPIGAGLSGFPWEVHENGLFWVECKGDCLWKICV